MIDRVLMVLGVALLLGLGEVVYFRNVLREKRRTKERSRIRITYRYTPRATGTEGVPRYEAGTDVAGTVQFPAHSGRVS